MKQENKMIEIKRWDNGEVIHSGEFDSIKDCLEDGIRKEISFWRANMRDADMCDADMRGADMRGANMRGANMRDANMRDANMCDADMRGANMRDADMRDADMRGANMRGANMRDANMRDANMRDADMCDADMRGADMRGAYGGNSRLMQLQAYPYRITVVDDICWGGCTKKTIDEWLEYSGYDLNCDDNKYLNTVTKPFIRMVIAMRESNAST